jgi:hypothetical protein
MSNRFDYVAYDEYAKKTQANFKEMFSVVEGMITDTFFLPLPNRSTELALTALEECYMWIGKAIRDEQIARNKEAVLQEERGNS